MAQEMTMLHDVGRCSACRACTVACKQWHDLPADMSTPFEGQYQSSKWMTPKTYTYIMMNERRDANGKFHWDFFKHQCMHCGDPGCANGCPEDAIEKMETGAVVIHPEKCVGCGYCTINCPFQVPQIDETTHKSTKCDQCYDRVAEGIEPSCSKTCTSEALFWGTRGEMMALAESRLKELKAEGKADANLYNPEGVCGIHMLYVLPEKPSVYGLPEAPKTPNASIGVWKDIVRPSGHFLTGAAAVGVVGLGILKAVIGKKGGH